MRFECKKKGTFGFARWCWSQEMWSHFLRKPPTVRAGNPLTLPSISILASTTPIIFTQTRLLRAFEASDSFSNQRFAQASTHWGLQWQLQRQAPTPKIKNCFGQQLEPFQLLEYQWSEGEFDKFHNQTSSDLTRRFRQVYDWGNLNDLN